MHQIFLELMGAFGKFGKDGAPTFLRRTKS